jgi:hypothetical protein
VAPYAKISFRERSATEVAVLTREGTAYTMPADDGSGALTLRFMATERPNWYVAQMSGPPAGGGLDLLYAVVQIDAAKREARSFKAIATDPKEITAGLRLCNDFICVEDAKAYAAGAMAYADKGGEPDVIYEITLE